MTNQQIKDELRRSACEDIKQWLTCSIEAFHFAIEFVGDEEWSSREWSHTITGIFFLLVAEALE